jgi:colanic acid/amylovoran biosynthesis protein
LKILVLNAGLSNQGNRALTMVLTKELRTILPNAEVNLVGPVAVDGPNIRIFRQLMVPPVSLKYLVQLTRLSALLLAFRLLEALKFRKKFKVNPTLAAYRDCDLILNSGGDHLSGPKFNMTSFMNIFLGLLMGKKVILYGESLGYFRNPIANFLAVSILKRTDAVFVREELSRRYLKRNKVKKPLIHTIVDPAFLLEPATGESVQNTLKAEGISELPPPVIGINISGMVYSRQNYGYYKSKDYVDIMCQVIHTILHEHGGTILLIPHVYTKGSDDREANTSVLSKLDRNMLTSVKVIQGVYEPHILKGIIGHCEMFVGARMHSTIASISLGIPTVGIAYSHKMHGILGETLGLEQYIIDVEDLESERLLNLVNTVWENRLRMKEDLLKKSAELKKNAGEGIEIVKRILTG